ncbi:PREDICTED: cilia- and flagella-associated protein 53-like [Nicotiana attenuata]|uniref:cilia- and flagella-associated protein 53-like n=1 Tax=Nicotiana attenuata TaxID=49451 RepID=UPI0009051C44|nr:PREDICTED: cilia- and flagella-associated protein 53-like [Nicotiana attenuata]
MGLRTYLVEVESIRRANIRSRIFLQLLEKYRRYRHRCCELHERLRTDPRNRALGEELEKRYQELLQTLHSKSELEEQLRLKDEELEVGKGVAAECEYLQGKLGAMQLEMEQSRAKVAEVSAEWRGKLSALESKVADLERMERAWPEASARATALEGAVRVHESQRESERATATLREARLEEQISTIDQEASDLADRVAALEEENEQLRAQAGPSRAAVPRQTHELWVYAEAQRDIFKNLWEAGTVTEAAFEEAREKAHEARANCGYDVATPEIDGGAGGDDDEPYGDDDSSGGVGVE